MDDIADYYFFWRHRDGIDSLKASAYGKIAQRFWEWLRKENVSLPEAKARFQFQIRGDDIEWFKEYCDRKDTTPSAELRDYIGELRREDTLNRHQEGVVLVIKAEPSREELSLERRAYELKHRLFPEICWGQPDREGDRLVPIVHFN
jgi:hypothetical protein